MHRPLVVRLNRVLKELEEIITKVKTSKIPIKVLERILSKKYRVVKSY